jgi:hypothetical protein
LCFYANAVSCPACHCPACHSRRMHLSGTVLVVGYCAGAWCWRAQGYLAPRMPPLGRVRFCRLGLPFSSSTVSSSRRPLRPPLLQRRSRSRPSSGPLRSLAGSPFAPGGHVRPPPAAWATVIVALLLLTLSTHAKIAAAVGSRVRVFLMRVFFKQQKIPSVLALPTPLSCEIGSCCAVQSWWFLIGLGCRV